MTDRREEAEQERAIAAEQRALGLPTLAAVHEALAEALDTCRGCGRSDAGTTDDQLCLRCHRAAERAFDDGVAYPESAA